jgi:hypothetical protein
MDDVSKIVLTVVAVLSLTFNVLQYFWSQARLKCRIGLGVEAQDDPPGTWIGASISISNIGSKPTYFSNLKVIRHDGDYFYPIFSLPAGAKIEPNDSVVGLIPVGHFVDQDIKDIVVSDGVWREYKISRKMLKKALKEITVEKVRLESLGFSVHPPSKLHDKTLNSGMQQKRHGSKTDTSVEGRIA